MSLAKKMMCGVALAAVLGTAPAWAQSSTPAASDSDKSVEKVVVTARKKSEALQKVPATVEVLTGDRLDQEGINSTSQFEYQVPGLMFGDNGFNGALVGIRGINSIRGFTGDESAVGINFDGVFQPQSGQVLTHMFDVERVEILKGPQGTLYGRNSNAGVINIISRAPTDQLEGSAQLSYGSYDTWRGEATYNVPLSEGHAVRLAGSFGNGDGYIENLLDGRTGNDTDFWAARFSYKGDFSDATSFSLIVQHIEDDAFTQAARRPAVLGAATFDPNGLPPPPAYQLKPATGFYTAIWDAPTNQDRQDTNIAATLDIDFGDVSLRSITGGAAFENDIRGDATQVTASHFGLLPPPGAFSGTQDGWDISQEFNLFSTDDASRLGWRLGLYYIHTVVEETRFQNDFTSPDINFQAYDDFFLAQEGDAYGIFGTVDYKLADNLKASVGLRYSWESKEQTQDEDWGFFLGAPPIDCSLPNATLFGQACNGRDTREFHWDGISGNAGLEWQASENSLVYLTYGRGFRSGAVGGVIGVENFFQYCGFNCSPFPPPPPGTPTLKLKKLDQETVDSFELGSKNVLADGRLTLNAALFHAKLHDALFFTVDPVTFRIIEGNIGGMEYTGLDLYVRAKLSDSFSVDFNSEFLDAEITEVGATSTAAFKKGNRPARSPDVSFVIGGNYDFSIESAGVVTLRAEYAYKSDVFFNPQNRLREDAVGLLNASARFDADRWYLFIAGRNLTGEEYLIDGGIPSNGLPGGAVGNASVGEPLMVEGGVGFKF